MTENSVDEFLLGENETPNEDERVFNDEGIERVTGGLVTDWSPAATFDVLFQIAGLSRQADPSNIELHTFAYLACLMSIFRGRPASDWGYTFSAVPPTLPFSPAIESALADLIKGGFIEATVPPGPKNNTEVVLARHGITDRGRQELEIWRGLTMFSSRVAYLDAATKTAVFSSFPAVVNSLSYEPQLNAALLTDGPRMLLTSVTSAPLYEQFAALLEVLGSEHEELIVPASLYLNFLTQQAQEQLDQSLEVQGDET